MFQGEGTARTKALRPRVTVSGHQGGQRDCKGTGSRGPLSFTLSETEAIRVLTVYFLLLICLLEQGLVNQLFLERA